MSETNPFAIALRQINDCADILKLNESVRAMISVPMRELHVSIPVRMDDGRVRVFQGFRVQYNDARGPCKGGIRFHPDETIDTVRALASWMTWKCSLLDLPLGGGKGGVICNPKELTPGELERLSRGYVRAVGTFISPEKDVPAPDVYTTPQIMAWMMDEYSKMAGENKFGLITGKPLPLGGSAGRGDATARGGMFTLREAARGLGVNLKNATVAIQGFGNAGLFAARLVESMFGSRIVALSDSKGGVLNRDGIPVDGACVHKKETGSIVGLPNTVLISNEEVIETEADILILAALENVVTERNADRIQAKIILELANGPTTPEGDDILYAKGVHVVPDFLCNAGGVTVSYFEMVQNMYLYSWGLEEIHRQLDLRMTQAYHQVLEASNAHRIHMRRAAYLVAVRRVVEAMQLRGWV